MSDRQIKGDQVNVHSVVEMGLVIIFSMYKYYLSLVKLYIVLEDDARRSLMWRKSSASDCMRPYVILALIAGVSE